MKTRFPAIKESFSESMNIPVFWEWEETIRRVGWVGEWDREHEEATLLLRISFVLIAYLI